jgi:diguanylate cyclase
VSTTPDNNAEWKQKYFTALDDIEKLEQQIKQGDHHLQTLRKGLSRLSLAAEGANPSLDKQLSALRDILRQEGRHQELARSVDTLSETLAQLESERKRPRHALATHLPILLEPFQDIELPSPTHKQLKALRRELEKGPADEDWEELLLNYSRMIRELCVSTLGETDKAPTKSGLLQRILGGDTTNGGDANKHRTPPDRKLLTQINSALLRLIDELPIPSAFGARLDTARKQLETIVSIERLPSVIDEIISVVVMAGQEESKEFATFLEHLNARLDDIQSYLLASVEQNDRAAQDRIELDSAVRVHVSEIGQSIAQSTDLNDLKHTIQERLRAITEKMDAYRNMEAERQRLATAQIETLTSQLKSTEGEAAKLRQAIVEQQARAQRDPLTQIPNRQAYNERIAHEEARWKRYKNPLSLVVCDVDHFKRVNDEFGHLAGDKVLCVVAKVLANNIRSADFAARYGGEEFVVIMPETTLEQAATVADKLRKEIEQLTFQFREREHRITASFGVAQFIGETHGEHVFHAADQALYQAKQTGRNRVCSAT